MPFQSIGTCVIVLNSSGSVLLGKRKNSYKAGLFGLPGGRVEIGEPLVLTAQRELLEETGLIATPKYLGAVRETQETIDFIHFVYLVDQFKNEPLLLEPDKCEGWVWFSATEIQGLIKSKQILLGHQMAIRLYETNQSLIDKSTTIP